MAKRFIDTNLFRKKWIRELEPEMKLFWVYLLTDCDHAGIWDVDVDRAAFQLNLKITEEKILNTFHKKIVPFKRDKWFVPKFIEYQYGELSENIRPHLSVIKILSKYGLYKGYINPLNEAKDKNKKQDKKQEQLKDIKENLSKLKKYFPNKNVETEYDKWVDYMLSKGKTYKSYSAAFRNWLRNDQFTTKNTETLAKQFTKTPTGLYKAFCGKCKKAHFPNDYQLKQSSCCGVEWVPTNG